MKKNKAFTLIEMLVTLGIVTVILSVTSYSYRRFNDSVALSNAGKEMTLDIRKMQVYGQSGKESSQGNGDFYSPYGIHIDLNDPTYYYTFVDMGDVNFVGRHDHTYTGTTNCDLVNSECLAKIPLRDGVEIVDICGVMENGMQKCSSFDSSIATLDITFTRPSSNADIRLFTQSGGEYMPTGTFRTGFIQLRSQMGKLSTVSVDLPGQVLIQY